MKDKVKEDGLFNILVDKNIWLWIVVRVIRKWKDSYEMERDRVWEWLLLYFEILNDGM